MLGTRGLFCGLRTAFVVVLAVCIGVDSSSAAEQPAVEMVRIQTHADHTRIVLETTAPVEPNLFTLGAPDRLVVDLPELQWRIPRPNGPVNSRLVREFRFGLFQPGVSRLILKLAGPARILGGNRRRIGRVHIYEIDLAGAAPAASGLQTASMNVAALPVAPVVDAKTKTAFARRQFDPEKAEFSMLSDALARALGSIPSREKEQESVDIATLSPPALSTDPPVAAEPASPDESTGPTRQLRIVLDPGHGGIDPGTGSALAVEEKAINLAFALQLRDLLAADARYEVFLTRETDRRVRLPERVRFARQNNADLFISIHADWSENSQAKGATAYTLSEEASVEALESIATDRGTMGEVAGVDLAAEREDVARLLVDLARRETQARSLKFAELVIDELAKDTKVIHRPVRRNNFHVLKAPDMPSVLLELGFVSNADDREKLASPLWRLNTAEAVKRAIDAWRLATGARDFANR